MRKGDDPIIVEQFFNTSIESVWKAITNVDQMRQWYFENIPSFKPEVGFETQFNVQSQDRNFLHMWKVTEVIPQRLIRYNWKFEGYQGDSYVVFELFKENNLTKLQLTAQVLEDFPEDIPEFKRESCVGGWTYFIKKSLKEFLE
ncbi:MAG: SRPBCC domain-containing protein [Desulfobacterales bacterium]|jgi:uncharacterized protein YndB with AHSA1/START domain